ncbi:ABC transporter ATP-binding protein [Marinovum sp. 2_MG-2023]|uniref:ABC transporter ATP-binding protein n=1 Tax=Roseobacteraceae TaxID=2854170 RepID=UPI001FD066FA|nr:MULTISPECIES: ABC transporter ATP-binding protein [Roseobacteraceae]MCJ7874537.1 ABC transporter ATP-binding protein [Phaeobacter sp. J2-8]MDO6732282.1 ABC transporter ATP-binding protein [Marinovum sp. 2_MG-2023]MDO6781599.1 ABC transporter ATP-binding protein [Marinovum sp. 1_MG-2023]
MSKPLLEVRDLTISIGSTAAKIDIVDGVSFSVQPNEPFGIVGESGSGKSMIALAIMGLLPKALKITSGTILFDGKEIQSLSQRDMQRLRGKELAMVFQEPSTALNPVFTTGAQLVEVLRRHEGLSPKAARARVIELFGQVGIPSPADRFDDYPHQMSGGMRQRVMIAMALCCNPRLIIADEPTTALDATIQLQIMRLLARLQKETGVAVMFISHDLALVSNFVRRVQVMYAGRLAECGTAEAVFSTPAHPYTEGLMRCAYGLEDRMERLPTIEGQVPTPNRFPKGCRFSTRCAHVQEVCRHVPPPRYALAAGHESACYRHIDFKTE